MAPNARLIIVSDFDGTITRQDIGNELCRRFIPDKFDELHRLYKQKKINLRDYQNDLWTHFPLGESEFQQASRDFSRLRDGCETFLDLCATKGIDVYVASCGIDAYIEPTLRGLSAKSQSSLKGLRCNKGVFSASRLESLTMPTSGGPYPLDKGQWCDELRQLHPGCRILGIGNGTSDQSMVGHTDYLAATESLATFLKEQKKNFVYFESWTELMPCLKEWA